MASAADDADPLEAVEEDAVLEEHLLPLLDEREDARQDAAAHLLEAGVGGAAMPPMRPNECVRRAPVSSSRMSQTISRALMNQRNGVNAPSSIAMAPVHVRWSLMRASSPSAMRYHWQRSGTTMPQSFSTASA
jgi:hypothetical protein